MIWLNLLWSAAGSCFFIGFIIIIIVGYAHGGKYRMSPVDPALLNEIMPTGKKWLWVAGSLILLSLILAGLAVILR
jgi:hypothetical protein